MAEKRKEDDIKEALGFAAGVYRLVEGEYQVTQFCGNDQIQSPTLIELNNRVKSNC
jgi:hypothetical protein